VLPDGLRSKPFTGERRSSLVRLILSVFILLHGLVHLLYSGHSRRLFELRPGMTWPDGSWVFSELLGDEATRSLSTLLYALAAIGFVVGSIGMLAGQVWSLPVIVSSAVFSAVIVVLFWDGKLHRLDDQGAIALLINITLVVIAVVLWRPYMGR